MFAPLLFVLSPDQYIYETITGDSGSASTGAVDATLNISGGTGLSTTVADGSPDSVTIAFTSTTGTGAVVLASSPTIVTPTIASFANATHDHADAAGGSLIEGYGAVTGDSGSSSALLPSESITITGGTGITTTVADSSPDYVSATREAPSKTVLSAGKLTVYQALFN